MGQNKLKKQVASRAIDYITAGSVIGVGTGSTVNYFISELAEHKHLIEAAVASSVQTEKLLKEAGIEVIDLNTAGELEIYIDGADEVNAHRQMIKGGGGALTREKIIASSSNKFICLVDETKYVSCLGGFPLPVEVIPMARSYVAREILKLGGDPEYRVGFVTDNGNIILDIHNLKITQPMALETEINNIAGVVTNGLFAHRGASCVLIASQDGVRELEDKT